MTTVTLSKQDGWAAVTLNRPERKNAITGELGQDLAQALEDCQQDQAVRAVLLSGAGGAFCSGLDIKEFNADPAPAWLADFQQIWRRAHSALYNCEKPIVCALERYAINGGAALAFACDLVVMGQTSFVQVGEVQQGMAAPYNLAWLALRYPEVVSAQMTLTGRRFNGEELKSLGIAYACVDDAQVQSEAQALAAQLGGFPAGAAVAIKTGMRRAHRDNADQWFDRFMPSQPNQAPQRQQ